MGMKLEFPLLHISLLRKDISLAVIRNNKDKDSKNSNLA